MNTNKLQERVAEIEKQLLSLTPDKQGPLVNELLEITLQLEKALAEDINKLDKEDE